MQEKIKEHQEMKIAHLKNIKDMKAVLAAKPEWEAAPDNIKFVALSIKDDGDFGKWCWLEKRGEEMDYVYQEARPE